MTTTFTTRNTQQKVSEILISNSVFMGNSATHIAYTCPANKRATVKGNIGSDLSSSDTIDLRDPTDSYDYKTMQFGASSDFWRRTVGDQVTFEVDFVLEAGDVIKFVSNNGVNSQIIAYTLKILELPT